MVGGLEDDDAAAWKSEAGTVVATTDTLVEGVDFRKNWPGFDFRQLGRRLMAVNLSDLAAMGALPRHALVSLALPSSTTVEEVEAIYRGIDERAQQFGSTLAGGDLSATAGPIVLTAALYGLIPDGKAALLRKGAEPGWTIAVTGSLGGAAAGLELAESGEAASNTIQQAWLKRLYDPEPRLEAAGMLRECGVSVAGDLSDGVYREVERLTAPFKLGAVLRPDDFPLQEGVRVEQVAQSEDFELICCAPQDVMDGAAQRLARDLKLPLTSIGVITELAGVFLEGTGRRVKLEEHAGYEHFRKV
jgi:thiamine-monophosphate kinase